VGEAEERKQMMLAEAVDLDISDDDHLCIGLGENSSVDHRAQIPLISGGEKFQRPDHTLRRPLEAFSLRVLTEVAKHALDQMACLNNPGRWPRHTERWADPAVRTRGEVARSLLVLRRLLGQRDGAQ